MHTLVRHGGGLYQVAPMSHPSKGVAPNPLSYTAACELCNYLNGGLGIPRDAVKLAVDNMVREMKAGAA